MDKNVGQLSSIECWRNRNQNLIQVVKLVLNIYLQRKIRFVYNHQLPYKT